MSGGTLATRVKAAREQAGLSQRQLPGVDSGLLSRIETGKVKDPAISTLDAIAKATGMTVDELNGAPASAVRMIALKDIEADPDNPRTVDVADTVDSEFVESIKEHGLLQAVTVRRMPAFAIDDGRPWRIAFGGRRYAALTLIHGPKSKVLVPCLVKDAGGADLLLKQLVENVRRSDMNPWDLARAITSLVDQKMDTQAIATALGRKRRWVQEMASVGRDLHANGRQALATGTISISQAVAIAAEKDEKLQSELLQRTVDNALNEDAIRAITAGRKERAKAEQEDAQSDLEDFLGDKSETPRVDPKPVGGWKTWAETHGHFQWRLVMFPEGTFIAETTTQWRREGSTTSGWSRQGALPKDTRAEALATAAYDAWSEFDAFATKADKGSLLESLLPWLTKGLRQQGGDEELIKRFGDKIVKRFGDRFFPDDSAKKGPTNSANNRKVKIVTAKPIDISEPPTWAQPIVGALFMYHTGRQAFLCKGWRQMAKTFSENLDADQEELRALYDRKSWANDLNGEPFDFGGAVVLLKDAPA